jgi:hypothetical protein
MVNAYATAVPIANPPRKPSAPNRTPPPMAPSTPPASAHGRIRRRRSPASGSPFENGLQDSGTGQRLGTGIVFAPRTGVFLRTRFVRYIAASAESMAAGSSSPLA